MNRYRFLAQKPVAVSSSKQPRIETSLEKLLEYNQTAYWYKEDLLSVIFNDYEIIEGPYITCDEEFFNNGGSSDYEKKTTPCICMTTSKLYQGERSPRTMRRYYFPRYEATLEDIQKLNGIPIKDALLRCGRNQKNGKYSNIWKFVSLFFADGTEYKLHGTLLPWHRFGDNYLDYEYEDHDIRAVFSEMKKLQNGKFRPAYDYHNVYQSDNQYSSSEVEDIIDDMREDGAQFSFDD